MVEDRRWHAGTRRAAPVAQHATWEILNSYDVADAFCQATAKYVAAYLKHKNVKIPIHPERVMDSKHFGNIAEVMIGSSTCRSWRHGKTARSLIPIAPHADRRRVARRADAKGRRMNLPIKGEIYDLDAEKAVLGAVLLEPRCLAEVAPELVPDDFFHPAHGLIFAAMLELEQTSSPVNSVSILDALKSSGNLDRLAHLGGRAISAVSCSEAVKQPPTWPSTLAQWSQGREAGMDQGKPGKSQQRAGRRLRRRVFE